MANSDRPKGAECKGEPMRVNKYTAAEAIYPGDFVNMNADGKVEPADASEALLGAAVAYAGTDEVCQVADDPQQLYVIQADDSDVDAQDDVNLNYNIVATAGDSSFRISRMELDADSGATTAALPLKLLEIDDRPDNALGDKVDCIVKINNHQLASGTGTAGV